MLAYQLVFEWSLDSAAKLEVPEVRQLMSLLSLA